MNITLIGNGSAIVSDGLGFPGSAHVSPAYCAVCHGRRVNGYGDAPCEHKLALVDLMECGVPADNPAADDAQRWNEQRGA
jgi:hypothetical protein